MRSPAAATGRPRYAEVAARAAFGAVMVPAVWSVLADRWRAAEAVLVRGVLHALGFGDVERYGHELFAVSRTGQRFSAAISPWCSTLALVLVFGAGVVVTHALPIRRRLRGLGVASAIVIVCNLVRIVATIAVGVGRGPGAIEPFHDGPATWFAVAYVLAAVAAFAAVLTRGAARGGTVQPPKSPQMEATTPGRL